LPRFVLANAAHADMHEIRTYIARERSQDIAEAVMTGLYAAMGSLAHAPRIGRVREEYATKPRSFAVPPHVIFYEPLKQEEGIVVWRVLHGARDLPKLLHRPSGDELS
jgi:plasmid stabilization system protein ParE